MFSRQDHIISIADLSGSENESVVFANILANIRSRSMEQSWDVSRVNVFMHSTAAAVSKMLRVPRQYVTCSYSDSRDPKTGIRYADFSFRVLQFTMKSQLPVDLLFNDRCPHNMHLKLASAVAKSCISKSNEAKAMAAKANADAAAAVAQPVVTPTEVASPVETVVIPTAYSEPTTDGIPTPAITTPVEPAKRRGRPVGSVKVKRKK